VIARVAAALASQRAVLAATLAVCASWPNPAHAATPVGSSCQSRMAALSRAVVDRAVTRHLLCEDRIARRGPVAGTNCREDTSSARWWEREGERLARAIADACPAHQLSDLALGGDCAGVRSPLELGACQATVVERAAAAMVPDLLDTRTALPESARRCRRTATRASLDHSLARLSRVAACKLRAIRAGDLAGTACATSGQGARPDAPDVVAARRVGRACSDDDVRAAPFAGACAQARDDADLATCLRDAQEAAVDDLLIVTFGVGASGTKARAGRIEQARDCVSGPLARCRPGDFLLENDRVRIVVQNVQRNLFGIGQFGGQVIDVARRATGGVTRAGDDRDSFEEWAFALNLENVAHYTDLQIVNDGSDGRPAVLRATGVDDLLDYINPSSAIGAFGLPFPAVADDVDLAVEIVTEYELAPATSWLTVRTTVQNIGRTQIRTFLGEFISGSGELELFQPGYGFGDPLVTTRCPLEAPNPCNVVAYRGYADDHGVSYGYVYDGAPSSTFTAGGVTIPILGQEVPLTLIGAEPPAFVLEPAGAPGQAVTVVRHFVVGDGSVSSLTDARDRIQHRGVGRLEGRVTTDTGAVAIAGAQVAILGALADGPGFAPLDANVVTVAQTDANGAYALTLAPGVYEVVAARHGRPYEDREATPRRHRIEIEPFAETRLNLSLPEASALRVQVTGDDGSPIAARVTLVGFDPSPDPVNRQDVFGIVRNATTWFGDPGIDGYHFGVAKVVLVGADGDSGAVALEPGRYRLVVSHGPEYSVDAIDVEVVAGQTTDVHARVARVVDTTGFVSADFHVHSIDSPDAAASRRHRVVSMLAEGVDFFTPTDHDFRADFQPTIEAMGVSDLVAVAPGAEITPFDYGHFNAWPMRIDPTLLNGGSVDFGGAASPGQDFPSRGHFNLTPGEIIAAAHADPGASNTVQINHIDSHFGIEGGFGLAIDTGTVPPQSGVAGKVRRLDPSITNYFSPDFDALELWVGDDRTKIEVLLEQNVGDWFNLLNQGIVRTAVSSSDTHQRFSGPAGMPRTMVASPSDRPGDLAALADTLSESVNAGRAVGTNGPWLRFSAHASSTGESAALDLDHATMLRTTDGAIAVRVEIQSPVWAEFDRVELYANATTVRRIEGRQISGGEIPIKRYRAEHAMVQTAGVDFDVRRVLVDADPSHARLEAVATFELQDLTEDTWLVALVRGSDGISRPLFPVVAGSLRRPGNETLAGLTDGNLGEDGVLAVAFTNALFIDVDGGGWSAPGLRVRDAVP